MDLTPAHGVVLLAEDRSGQRRFGPFPLDAPRDAVMDGLVRPAALPDPRPGWAVSEMIPYGTQRGWREHWAALLLDVAQSAWALRPDGPEPLPGPMRFTRVGLGPLGGDALRRASILVVEEGATSNRCWTITVPIPVPAARADAVATLGLTIAEWIAADAARASNAAERLLRL